MLVPLACLCLLPLAAPGRADAQVVPEVVKTGHLFKCGDASYELTIVSAALRDGGSASSLGFVVTPSPGEKGALKIFQVYSIDSADGKPNKRDDDNGTPDLKNYDGDKIGGNLGTFISGATRCPAQEPNTAAVIQHMADVLKASQFPLSAEAFARAAADKGAPFNVNPQRGLQPIANPAAGAGFANSVRAYIVELMKAPGGGGNVEELQAKVVELNMKVATAEISAAAARGLADGLRAQLDAQAGNGRSLSRYLGWILLAATLLAAFLFRKKLLSLMAAGGRMDDAEIIRGRAELLHIKKNSRASFEGMPKHRSNERCWKEAEELLGSLRKFRQQQKPRGAASRKLNQLISEAEKDLRLSRQTPMQLRPPDLYELIFRNLLDFEEEFYPPTGSRDAAGQPKPDEAETAGASQSDVPKTREVEVPEAISASSSSAETSPAAPTTRELPQPVQGRPADAAPAAVVLDPSSLDAIRELISKQLGALPELLDGGQQHLKALWALWATPGEPFDKEAPGKLVSRSKEGLSLIKALNDELGLNDHSDFKTSKKRLENFFDDLGRLRNEYLDVRAGGFDTAVEILGGVEQRLRRHAAFMKEYQATQEKMGILHSGNESVFATAQRLVAEHHAVLELLKEYRSGVGTGAQEPVRAVLARVRELNAQLERVEELARGGLEEAGETGMEADATAAKLVGQLGWRFREARALAGSAGQLKRDRDDFERRALSAEPQAAKGKELALRVADYLNFDPSRLDGEAGPAEALLARLASERGFYSQLRLRLAGALVALDEALAEGEREDVTKALRIENVRTHLAEFARSLEDIDPGQLWERGVSSGFSQGWLNDLFRANLLLQYYFDGEHGLGALRDAVSQACDVLESAMRRGGVQVVHAALLEDKRPGVDEERNALPALVNLPEVRRKVEEKFRAEQRGGFVVDVQQFSVKVGGAEKGVQRVTIMNPSDWR